MCSWCRCAEDYEKAMAVIDAARAWEKAGPWGLYCAKELRALVDAVRALDEGTDQ